jgi:hypothetical protein
VELQNLWMARGTLKVARIVTILFGAFRGRFELFRTACAPLKIDKNFKINHPNNHWWARQANSTWHCSDLYDFCDFCDKTEMWLLNHLTWHVVMLARFKKIIALRGFCSAFGDFWIIIIIIFYWKKRSKVCRYC